MGRTFIDAGAQSTSPSAITNSQTTLTLQSTANFGGPSTILPTSIVILDSGNPAWNASSPLATPYEYQLISANNTGTNTLTINSGTRSSYAGTTPKSFFAGATVAAVLLAEDLNLVPQRFATQNPSSGTTVTQTIPSLFRHIDIIYDLAVTGSNTDVFLQFNLDSGNHYYWASDGAGSDLTRTGANGGVAVNSGLVGFVGTSTALTWDSRLRINDIQQSTRRIGWTWEGTFGNVGAPNLVSLRGGGEWFPSVFAPVSSVTIFIGGGTITSSNFDFIGYP